MQWQRLLRSAAAVGAVAVACAVPLQAADPPAVTPTSLSTPTNGRVVASVRALVNGVPILEAEVTEAALGPLGSLNPNSPSYESDVKKVKAAALEQLIDRELLLQDARTKLLRAKKGDVLEKVAEEADGQFERWAKQARAAFPNDEVFRQYLLQRGTSYEGQRRLRRRIYLAEQYLHSNVMRPIEHGTGHQELYDYYRAHPEEFQRTDNVQWQDIFIDAGDPKKYPTRADAYRKAQELQGQARAGGSEDFVRLCKENDDGLAKTKKDAAGIGTRREDISPPEVAATLFQLRDGEVGPIVSVPAGFHVLRLVKRTHAGMAPFDDDVQKAIRDKLRNEIYTRESKRFLDELKQQAHIERMP
jgi:parvulin-like peptidyl-prolyl isomerase